MGNCEVSAGEVPIEAGVEGVSTKGGASKANARAQERGEALRLGPNDKLVPALHSTVTGEPAAEAEAEQESESTGPSGRHEVWLHVYDLESVTARLNPSLKGLNLGAFHCGVEVLDDEWFFAWGDSSQTGVVWNFPKGHQVHIYRESVFMGETPLTAEAINEVLCDVMECWPANSYHPITRNCVTFAEELITALKAPEPFPGWVRGALDVGKSPAVLPIANMGWRWVEWYCKRKTDEENAAQAALEEAQLAAEREELQARYDAAAAAAAAAGSDSGLPVAAAAEESESTAASATGKAGPVEDPSKPGL
mmetsp:Transcript_30780/g.71914  ORF Transcript_30780/g.71914 Transcript_30780/m.71914 type:complete len:308 (-) Transcript_30780:13-936(-)